METLRASGSGLFGERWSWLTWERIEHYVYELGNRFLFNIVEVGPQAPPIGGSPPAGEEEDFGLKVK